VRELHNTLTRAAILARGPAIGPEHLSLGAPVAAGGIGVDEADPSAATGAEAGLTLESAIQAHVRRVLAVTGGNKSEAARVMRISRSRLNRILRRMDGPEPDDA
jgi:DNA-binding NtrC family response regulator